MRRFINFLLATTIIVFITSISCTKEANNDFVNNTCGVSNPAEEISWLKDAIDEVKQDEYSYYIMATYKEETVFFYGNCNPVVNYISIIRNCNGDSLGYRRPGNQNELTNLNILWKHEDSKCNF